MMKLLSSEPLWQKNGLLLLRVVTGLLMAYHGLEVFKPEVIKGYTEWDVIKKLPSPLFMVYLGKGLELVTGICLTIGLFTRLSALFMFIDMIFICFKVGGGKFYYEDQHPFLFAMIALVFFFTGPVKWGLDFVFFKQRKKY
ncbi:MAG: DoxX family protein [Bacteroidota bacterium]